MTIVGEVLICVFIGRHLCGVQPGVRATGDLRKILRFVRGGSGPVNRPDRDGSDSWNRASPNGGEVREPDEGYDTVNCSVYRQNVTIFTHVKATARNEYGVVSHSNCKRYGECL